ncbi:MAG: hypothetical protein AB8B53_06675 [Flavobacteriales bacterium]
MPFILKLLFLGIIFASFSRSSYAHEGRLTPSASLGITTPLLDNGIGFSAAVNLTYDLTSHFATESQVSFIHTRVSSSFLSGNQGGVNSLNYFFGARLYLTSPEKTYRFYINLLPGISLNSESSKEFKKLFESIKFGATAGAFLELEKVFTGISIESPQNLLLKVGYIF